MTTNLRPSPFAPDTLSLFSGLGGLDLGAHLAGWRVASAIDADPSALSCLHQALGTPITTGFTEQLDPEDVIARSGMAADGSAILIGGPPCTAFSHAGFWLKHKRDGSDHQTARIDDFWTYVRLLRPRAFLMENVPGLAFQTHSAYLESLERKARRNGYSISTAILDASDFGVPQARRRLFVVGLKSRSKFAFPKPTFAGARRSSGWAVTDLSAGSNPAEKDEKLTGKYSDLLPLVPRGGNYLHFTKERGYPRPIFGWRKRYWSFLLKLDPNEPSPTIPATRVTNNGPFHWRNRRLRIRELARLQGFPDNYPLDADLTLARRHIGNAVPPLFAAQLLWQLKWQLGEASANNLPNSVALALDPSAAAQDVSDALASVLVERHSHRS